MDAAFFARGIVIGFAIAAPVGAIGLLCIRRTLADGRLAGFVTGLGAATADALYGVVAALGLTSISSALVAHADAVRLVGGVFLVFLGFRTATAAPVGAIAPAAAPLVRADVRSLAAAYATTVALTLTNPGTILSFAAVFAGLGLAEAASDRGSAALLVVGVFLGSAAWWLVLSTGVGFARRALTPDRLRLVNRASGAMLAAFGAVALLGLLR